jgi:hypothetical protein
VVNGQEQRQRLTRQPSRRRDLRKGYRPLQEPAPMTSARAPQHLGLDLDLADPLRHSYFSGTLGGGDEGGIEFDYVDNRGNLRLPNSKAPRDMKVWQPEHFQAWGVITYSEFDAYDAETDELTNALIKLSESVTPIIDFPADFANAVEEAISSSDNVIRFPKTPQKSDESPAPVFFRLVLTLDPVP